jgi:hypothetical protein
MRTILQTHEGRRHPDAGEIQHDARDILHFKMMLFDGQNMVEFSKANYSPEEFIPIQVSQNYSTRRSSTRTIRPSPQLPAPLPTIAGSTRRSSSNFANISGTVARKYSLYSIASLDELPADPGFFSCG